MRDCIHGVPEIERCLDCDAMPHNRIPQAISESVMNIAGHGLRVYNLDDGRRIVDAEDVQRFFGIDAPASEEKSK